ncbi:DUF2497 domain-containing protein [Litorimonas haliclonae]|uniref:DUF2497 domain-containing protein n=1 Tax=Litorimonas haliclonae TaxID=2081977 RepID=UPI0039F06CD4
MSETTSESEQAHLADEPSMEDILDSIRKIIADDDQKMDISAPQALSSGDSEDGSLKVEPSLSPASLISETVSGPSADYKSTPVFHQFQSDASPSNGGMTQDDDTVDLDIEALLSEAQTPAEAPENLTFETFSDDGDVAEMLDIEIPELPEEPPAAEADTSGKADSVVEPVTDETWNTDILDLSDIINEEQPTVFSEADTPHDDEDDSLFDQLEGLLAETPENRVSSQAVEEKKASGSETIAESSPETLRNSEAEDEFEGIDDILAEAMQNPNPVEDASVAPESTLMSAEEAEKPAFHSDDDDMNIVKSLMADLTEPEETIREEMTAEEGSDEEDLDDSDILDEIINMSLEDELGEEAELQIPEPEAPPASVELPSETSQETSSETLEDDISLEDLGFDELEPDAAEEAFEDSRPEESNQAEESAAEKQPSLAAQSLISSLREIAGEAERDALEAEAKLEAAHGSSAQSVKSSEDKEYTAGETSPPEAAKISPEDVQTSADVVEISAKTNPKETADMPKAAVNQDRILDEVSGEAASNAFASLNNMVEEKAIKAERGDRIGDLVMEALRPMLKEWLDEHLNDIVERAVTKEVQRISSGK